LLGFPGTFRLNATVPFGFLSDFENVPKRNYAIVETRKVSEGPVGVETIY
jgi:hypothetical protein